MERLYWRAATSSAGLANDASEVVTVPFGGVYQRGRRWRLHAIVALRIGANTVSNVEVTDVHPEGLPVLPGVHIVMQSTEGPRRVDARLCDWSGDSIALTITNRTGAAGTFSVGVALVDDGPEEG